MLAVAIWETTDAYNALLKPHCNFIGWVGILFVPMADIIRQILQLGGYLPFVVKQRKESRYFPIQNFENITSNKSSVVICPVISPK